MAMHANKCLPQEKNAFMTRNSTIRSFSSIKVRYIVKINQEGRAASNIWQYKNDSVIIFYMQIISPQCVFLINQIFQQFYYFTDFICDSIYDCSKSTKTS